MNQRQRHAIGTEAAAEAVKLSSKRSRAVNDDEVEEFFAILKRLQEVKRLKSGGNSVGDDSEVKRRSGRCGAIAWQPVFTLEDFKDASNGGDRIEREDDDDGKEHGNGNENEVVSRSFDLNAEPEVDRSDELLIN